MKTCRTIILTLAFNVLFMSAVAFGQLVDSFSDGNFTANPAWGGTTSAWQIVTDSDVAAGATNSNTLRLNVSSGEGTQYLSTQRTDSWGTEQSWGFWLGRRKQAATEQNHSIVWLWASEADLTSPTVDGYRVRFGDDGGDDEVYLQRVDNGTATNILTSSGVVTNGLTDIGFLVRVTRSATSVWTLYTSTLPTANGTGAVATDIPSVANTSVNQGSVTDATYTNFTNGYFGFMAVHTSGENPRTGAEFDQLYFSPQAEDPLPVELTSFTAEASGKTVTLKWSTATETENLGFHLYRSERIDSEYKQINEKLIPGAGNSTVRNDYSWVDRDVVAGNHYFYKLAAVDFSGNRTLHGPVSIAVAEGPVDYSLAQNYPNPFSRGVAAGVLGNMGTIIQLGLPEVSKVKLQIFTMTGQHLLTLVDDEMPPGGHSILWNGRDQKGSEVAAGIYFYTLTIIGSDGKPAFTQTRKMILVP